MKPVRSQEQGRENFQTKMNKPKKDLKDVECFNCHKKGHYLSKCPNNVMLCVERTVNGGVISKIKEQRLVKQLGTLKSRMISVRDMDVQGL